MTVGDRLKVFRRSLFCVFGASLIRVVHLSGEPAQLMSDGIHVAACTSAARAAAAKSGMC
jgi:hypothetical protein